VLVAGGGYLPGREATPLVRNIVNYLRERVI